MAKIHGISGSTKYLLKEVKTINGKDLVNFNQIRYLYRNYEKIIAETEKNVGDHEDTLILELNNDLLKLDAQIKEGIAQRTIEVYRKIAELSDKVNTTKNPLKRLGNRIQYQVNFLLRFHRINSPFKHRLRELNYIKSQKEALIAGKPAMIALARKNVSDTYTFLEENMSFFLGAEGEESVIEYLSQLSDEYHVFNDVNLRFDPPIHWKKHDESIVTSQIDHIVIGPTGMFLLETKNWNPSDFEGKSEKLEYQMERSGLALWYYLKHQYRRDEMPRIRKVIVFMQGFQSSQKLGKYIDVVNPDRLCSYITNRKTLLSGDGIKKLTEIIPRRRTG